MPTAKVDPSESAKQRQRALQRWDNEGGASPGRLPAKESLEAAAGSAPPLNNAELVQLHIRVIALENVVIALLAQATEAQLELVRDMQALSQLSYTPVENWRDQRPVVPVEPGADRRHRSRRL